MKKVLILLAVVCLSFSLIGCETKEKGLSKEEKIEVWQNLDKIQGFVREDYWNKLIIVIDDYVAKGTVSEDFETKYHERYEKAFSQMQTYNAYITELPDDFSDIKKIWEGMYADVLALDTYIKEEGFVAGEKGFLPIPVSTSDIVNFSNAIYALEDELNP